MGVKEVNILMLALESCSASLKAPELTIWNDLDGYFKKQILHSKSGMYNVTLYFVTLRYINA